MLYTVLLVWEEIPESTTLYLLELLPQAEYDMILKAHGQYVNTGDENDEVLWLSEFLQTKEACKIEGPFEVKEALTVIVAGFAM